MPLFETPQCPLKTRGKKKPKTEEKHLLKTVKKQRKKTPVQEPKSHPQSGAINPIRGGAIRAVSDTFGAEASRTAVDSSVVVPEPIPLWRRMVPVLPPTVSAEIIPESSNSPPPVVTTDRDELPEPPTGVTVVPAARITCPPGAEIVPELVTFVPTRATVPLLVDVMVPALVTAPVGVPQGVEDPKAMTPAAETTDPDPKMSPLGFMKYRSPLLVTEPLMEDGVVPPI